MMPRTFTAGQQRQITDWEYGRSWRTLPAGQIFPASVSYQAPVVLDDSSLMLTARRIGIARQSGCRAATDAAAAAVLARNGCSAMLRATYADGTDSYVVTVGVAVLPSTAQADGGERGAGRRHLVGGIEPGVHALAFRNTPRPGSPTRAGSSPGPFRAGTYVALYTVGYADGRPREPVTGDSYADGEMTSVGSGVAQAVLAKVGAPVPAAALPGDARMLSAPEARRGGAPAGRALAARGRRAGRGARGRDVAARRRRRRPTRSGTSSSGCSTCSTCRPPGR